MDDHEIVFTHSDLAPWNILVDGGRVTAILDWEYAGWYPAHWEYCQALRHLRPMFDWPEYLARIFPPKFEIHRHGFLSSCAASLADWSRCG
jgi:aminoglycoside phosphotransferase (APT) family kinase protein